jgi:hypothetical protein
MSARERIGIMAKHGKDRGPQTPEEIRAAISGMADAASVSASEPKNPRTCKHTSIVVLSGVKVCNQCNSDLGPARVDE